MTPPPTGRLRTLLLEEPRFAKRIHPAALRVAFRITDYYVVEQLDFEDLRGFAELPRDVHVGLTWGRVSTRMIVGDDECAASSNDRTAENLATGNQCRINRSQRDEVPAQWMILAVEIHAVERLLKRVFVERRAKIICDFVGPVELNFFAERNE